MTLVSDVVSTAVDPFTKYVKFIFIGIVVTIILGILGTVWYLKKELTAAEQKNGQLTEQVRTLSQDLQLVKIGQTAMGLGQLLSDQQKEDLDKKARETRNRLKAREAEIDKTIKDPEQKAALKSQARMTSVWEMYCHVQPSNAICQQRSAPAQANAPDKETPQQGSSK